MKEERCPYLKIWKEKINHINTIYIIIVEEVEFFDLFPD